MDAKYGAREEMEGKSWENELRRRGLGYIRLSHSSPGDVELGHKLVREYLQPHHSILIDKTKPGMLFSRNGCGGTGGPIHHMFNYQYKPDRDDPDKAFKDFPDFVRYAALEEPVYRNPMEEDKIVDILLKRKDDAYDFRRRRAVG